MPYKFTDAQIDHFAELIKKGSTLKDAAKVAGCKGDTLTKAFRRRGIVLAKYLHNPRQNSLPQDEIISRYIAGESELTLATAFNCSRGTISKILHNNFIPRRSGSEANCVRMSKFSIEERKKIVSQANSAMRGKNPIKRLTKKAISAENHQSIIKVGPGEIEIGEALKKIGHQIIRQKAIGIYNIDIVFGTVAVEVKFGTHSRSGATKSSKRIKQIIESGYKPVIVLFMDMTSIAEGLDDIVALLDSISRKPSLVGQYWVIRSGLQASRIRKPKNYGAATIESPPELVTSIRKVDIY